MYFTEHLFVSMIRAKRLSRFLHGQIMGFLFWLRFGSWPIDADFSTSELLAWGLGGMAVACFSRSVGGLFDLVGLLPGCRF